MVDGSGRGCVGAPRFGSPRNHPTERTSLHRQSRFPGAMAPVNDHPRLPPLSALFSLHPPRLKVSTHAIP